MKRIPQLDGLRGIAVLMVFAYHALHVPLMWAGVDLFFVLTGYLITGILLRLKEDHDTAEYWSAFYFRRILRIAPPYLGLVVILTLLFPIPWRHLWYWYAFFGANFASALGKCSVHAMDPLWSLAVEEQFYFVWPWVVLLASRKTLKRAALGIMVGAPVLRAIFTPMLSNRAPIYDLTPFRADLLACGAFVAICASEDGEWIERWRSFSLMSLTGAGTLLIGLSAFPSFRLAANSELFNTVGYSLIVIIFGAVLVWTLGMSPGFWRQLFASRPLRYMGQVSYTFYLYQVAVIDKLSQHIRSRPEVVVLAFVITGLFSAFSWHFFESQILKLRLDQPSLASPQTSFHLSGPIIKVRRLEPIARL
jgi:peptidoglycan/LPS O-acetylase OafA/YrhL